MDQCTHCIDTYFLRGLVCQKCTLNCKSCINQNQCQQCLVGYRLNNQACQCLNSWYVNDICTDIYGCMAMSIINNTKRCLICSGNHNFIYDSVNFTCKCKKGYKFSNDKCVEKCGDGLHYTQQCDDKNTNDFDGCSSQCKIEKGYICQGHWSDPSICKIKADTLKISPLYIVRKDGQNAAELHFKITPPNQNLNRHKLTKLIKLNTSELMNAVTSQRITFQIQNIKNQLEQSPIIGIIRVQTEVKLTDAYVDTQKSKLVVSFSFEQSVIDTIISAKIDFSSIVDEFQPISVAFSTQNISPALTYDHFNQIWFGLQLLSQIIGYLLLLYFLVSVVFHKMLGVQLLNAIQILVGVSILSNNQQSTIRVFSSMKTIFGFTPIFNENYLSLINPQKYRFFSEHRQIALNINIFLIVLASMFLVFLVLKLILITKKIQLQKQNKILRRLMKRALKKKYSTTVDHLIKQTQQTRFLLKDSIFHLNFRFLLLYERLLYPFSIILVPSTILYVSMYATSSKKGQEFGQIWSLLTVVLLTLITLSVSVYEQRKFTSDKKIVQKTGKYQFSTFNISCKIENLRMFSCLSITVPLLSAMLISLSILLQISNMISFIIATLYILLVIYIKISNPYILKIHNLFLVLLYTLIVLHSILIGLVNFGLIKGNSLIFIFMIEMGLIVVLIGLGCFCIYKEKILSDYNISKLALNANQLNQQKMHQNLKHIMDNNPFAYKKPIEQLTGQSEQSQQFQKKFSNKKEFVKTKEQQKADLAIIKDKLRNQLLRKRNYEFSYIN